MLKYSDLKKGIIFTFQGDPWVVLDSKLVKLQRQKPVLKSKIRNLKSGSVITASFTQSDQFEEAGIERRKIKFVYSHRGSNIFSEIKNPSKRMEISEDIIGEKKDYLKPNSEVEAVLIDNEIVDIQLPVKAEFKVIECPPSFKGNTAVGGTKTAVVETGAKINVPMFIQTGDIIRINTQEGSYVERVEKSNNL